MARPRRSAAACEASSTTTTVIGCDDKYCAHPIFCSLLPHSGSARSQDASSEEPTLGAVPLSLSQRRDMGGERHGGEGSVVVMSGHWLPRSSDTASAATASPSSSSELDRVAIGSEAAGPEAARAGGDVSIASAGVGPDGLLPAGAAKELGVSTAGGSTSSEVGGFSDDSTGVVSVEPVSESESGTMIQE